MKQKKIDFITTIEEAYVKKWEIKDIRYGTTLYFEKEKDGTYSIAVGTSQYNLYKIFTFEKVSQLKRGIKLFEEIFKIIRKEKANNKKR